MWHTPVFKHWFMVHTIRKICALHFLVELAFILIFFFTKYVKLKKWKFRSWMSLASEIEHLIWYRYELRPCCMKLWKTTEIRFGSYLYFRSPKTMDYLQLFIIFNSETIILLLVTLPKLAQLTFMLTLSYSVHALT